MQALKLERSADGTQATLSLGQAALHLSAQEVDRLIRDLAALRMHMKPVHPAEPPDNPARLHVSDNLLWSVRPAPARPAIEIAMHHPGLGWCAMTLSRAQVEDLQISIEVALAQITRR